MNKSELVQAVASGAGVPRAEAEGVLTALFDTVKAQLREGETVSWPGFGKFATAARSARTGRNPQTGESVQIAATTVARFSPSSLLKADLNAKAPAKKAGGRKAGAAKATASTARAGAKKAPAKASAATTKATKATAKATTKKATTAKKAGR